jgi:hypothetical protein
LSDCVGTSASAWPQADALFQSDPVWLGADGAYSADLGGGRVLWTFGDTFLANGSRDRGTAHFIHNSIAIQHGYDPSSATIDFHWGGTEQVPDAFMSEQGSTWFWPGAIVRLDTTALLFYSGVKSTSAPDGFQAAGWSALIVENPADDPGSWRTALPRFPPVTFPVTLGTAAVVSGDYLYAYGIAVPGDGSVYVARIGLSDANNGDLSQLTWWTGGGTWTAPQDLNASPADVFPMDGNNPTEMSITLMSSQTLYEVQSVGYGATDLAARTSVTIEGPFSLACRLYHPPQSDAPNAFVYAGKAHPELTGADLVATYVPTSFVFDDVRTNGALYVPHFVRIEGVSR